MFTLYIFVRGIYRKIIPVPNNNFDKYMYNEEYIMWNSFATLYNMIVLEFFNNFRIFLKIFFLTF